MSQLAAGDGSHVIDIDFVDKPKRTHQLAPPTSACHAIDVNVDRTTAPPEPHDECAVCMERVRWVAVGPCGHREVCSKCTVRIRSVGGNRLCCICRTPCPAVVVTRRSRAGGDGRHVYTKLPPSLDADEGPVGDYWYHQASAVYFDDERQYNATKRACSELERAEARDGDESDDAEGSSVVVFLVYVLVNFVGGMMMSIGYPYPTADRHWGHEIAMVLGSGFGFAAMAIMLWFLLDWLHRQRGRQ